MATMNTTSYRYNDDGLDSDEEEAERLLSEEHGEAADDSAAKKRKRTTSGEPSTTKLTEEDAAAAKEFEEKVRRKKSRPTLQPEHLKSSKGLIFVRRSFPTTVKPFRDIIPLSSANKNKAHGTGIKSSKVAKRLNTTANLNSAARYSRSLISAYTNFASNLFPSLAVDDVFLKVDSMGSKKEIKDYLTVMRNDMRKEYMEGIYGEEKAGRIFHELEYGMSARAHPVELADGFGYGDLDGADLDDGARGGVMASRRGVAVDDSDGETEFGGNDNGGMEESVPVSTSGPKTPAVNPYAKKKVVDNAADVTPEKETDGASNDDAEVAATDMAMEGEEEEGEEAEATFDDVENNTVSSEDKDGAPVEADEPTEPAVEKNAEDNAEEVVEGEPVARTEEAAMRATNEKEIDSNNAIAAVEPSNADNAELVCREDELETPTQVPGDDIKTQESLTLMESQFDDVEMEYTQDNDDRFSQTQGVSTMNSNDKTEETAEEENAPTRKVHDDGMTQDTRFSQTQNETADDRFSQFTQGTEAHGAIFEEEDGNEEEGTEGDNNGGGVPLGQTMETQLSMEY